MKKSILKKRDEILFSVLKSSYDPTLNSNTRKRRKKRETPETKKDEKKAMKKLTEEEISIIEEMLGIVPGLIQIDSKMKTFKLSKFHLFTRRCGD